MFLTKGTEAADVKQTRLTFGNALGQAKFNNIMTKTVLIVDNDTSIREALGKVLYAAQYEVVSSENGPAAIDKFGGEKIDLLLLDPGLTDKDNWGALKWLAKVNPLLPIVMITSRSNQHDLAEGIGADALMEKPLDMLRLLPAIRELIDEPVAHRIRRAYGRASDLRRVPSDQPFFSEELHACFACSSPCPAV
jgi:DNA-binding response OmpR family regulator